MKKWWITAVCGILLLTGCGSDSDISAIEGISWSMTSVQKTEENGKIIIVGEEDDRNSDEIIMELLCSAENGLLTVIDNTAGTTYTGSYTVRSESPYSFLYDILLEGETGHAVSAMTTCQDGTQIPTLILSFPEYTVNFQTEE